VTTTAARGATDRDPDALAALEEQREFLLRSLDDLEAERAAGDIDEHDYETLRDDYTARAAAVLRAIEARRSATRSANRPRRRGRSLAIGAAVVVAAVLAGVLVAQASGRRDPGDGITGGGGENSRSLLAAGDQQMAAGDYEAALATYSDALEIDPGNVDLLLRRAQAESLTGEIDAALATYDEVLAAEPGEVEALAYQAGLFHQQGDSDRALAQLDQAIEADPGFLDAWGFRLAILAQLDRFDDALSAIEELAAGGDADIALAVAQQASTMARSDPPTLTNVQALQVYDALLEGDPDNAMALTYRGWELASLVIGGGLDDDDATVVLEEALPYLDRAAEADPLLPDAHVFRAIVLNRLGRTDEAAEALAAFDRTDPPPEMEQLVEQFGLRDALGGE
jgi:tetratricopeptide (TPR) repeat protein